MADITKTGDWDGFARMLAEAGSKFKANVRIATHKNGRMVEHRIVDRIRDNQVKPPTSDAFRKWKINHGFSETTLIMSGDLIDVIKYENKSWNEGFIGVNRNAEGKDGQSLISIAKIMEYGPSKAKKGLPKPFIRPVVEQVGKQIAENYQKAIDETFKK